MTKRLMRESVIVSHNSTCPYHSDFDEVEHICNSYKKDGLRCTRVAMLQTPGYLPTCRQHAGQLMIAGRCVSIAECGKRCGRMFAWNPPFPQLCPAHYRIDPARPCYLLQLPTELRLNIFRYIFPSKLIEAGFKNPLYWNGRFIPRIDTSLFYVNRQISAEAAQVLYGTIPFCVEITDVGVSMCGKFWARDTYGPNQRENIHQRFASINIGRIRSFRIEIRLSEKPYYTAGEFEDREAISLYNVRDSVRKFLSLLRPNQQLLDLTVIPCFFGFSWQPDEVVCAAQFAVSPFRRLRRVARPFLDNINGSFEHGGMMLSLDSSTFGAPSPIGTAPKTTSTEVAPHDSEFGTYQKTWEATLASNDVVDDLPILFEKYDKLEEIASDLVEALVCDGSQVNLAHLLHQARVARETNDHLAFFAIQREFVTIWRKWVHNQTIIQNRISKKFKNILADENTSDMPLTFCPEIDSYPLDEPMKNLVLPRLVFVDKTPKSTEPGVSIRVDDEGTSYITKDNTTFIRLRTPEIVRNTRKGASNNLPGLQVVYF